VLVRVVEEYEFRRGRFISPGGLVSVPDDVAARLIEEGVAVPYERDEQAVERRSA
jgi:hypothetical protein